MDNARGEIVRQEAEAVNIVCMNILTSRIRQPLTHKRFYHGLTLNFFLPRRYASTVLVGLCLFVCLCLSHVGVLSKRPNESSCCWHGGFLRPVLHCVMMKFSYLKVMVLLSGTSSSTLYLISPRHVDRRNLLSTTLIDGRALLTTLATVDAPLLDRRSIHSPRS